MNDATYHLQGAYSHYQKGNYIAAEKWVAEILRVKPFNADAQHLGALIALAQGDVPTATTRIEAALTRAPENAEILNTLGNVHSARHDPVRAEKSYLAALALQAEYIAPRQNLAFLLLNQLQPHLAVPHFETLISAKPKNATYKLGYAEALKECGRYEDALQALQKIKGKDSADMRASMKAQILFLSGDDKGALVANKTLLKTGRPDAVERFAQISHMSGTWAEGAKTLLSKGQDASTSKDMIAAIAKAHYRASDIDAAMNMLSSEDISPKMLAVRSEIYLSQGKTDQAYEDAKAALTAIPGDLEFMSHFARAALASGRVEDCMFAAESALKIRPNDQFWIAMLATGGRVKDQNYGYYYDYDTFVRPYDLEAPEGYTDIAAFNAALKWALIEHHEFKRAPLDQSLRRGIQTREDLRFNDSKVIQDFFKALDAPIRDYMTAIGYDVKHPLRRRNTGNYRLGGAWSVKLTSGGYHVNHVHPQGWLSSSYYVEVPAEVDDETSKAGWIQFGQPPKEIADSVSALTAEKFIQPKPGRLVLFPSYMWHGTIPISGDAARMTLPFDVLPA